MNASIWEASAQDQAFDTLTTDLEVDVAIVGGGITGVTTAALCAEAGLSVAVLEAYGVGRGTTARSTGNLYATVDNQLYTLADKWDARTALEVAQSRRSAIDLIAGLVHKHNLDCDYRAADWYLFASGNDKQAIETIEHEQAALRQAGFAAEFIDKLPIPLTAQRGIMLPAQAQFNPLAYTAGLAAAVRSTQCQFFERCAALEIDDGVIKTPSATVRARHIVMATHTPKGFHPIQTELGPYSEYGVAGPVDAPLAPGVYWSLGESKHSIRGFSYDGRHYAMVIGSKHKTGQADDTQACYRALEDYLRAHFKVGEITHRWTAQHFRPADGLPYIGRLRGEDNVYIASGYATDGLVYGTLAAMLLCDAITGKKNRCAELYSARRFAPLKSAGEFIKENTNVAAQMAKDLLTNLPETPLEELQPGEGRLIEYDGQKAAACRDAQGQLRLLSPFCTHMKCIVHWNRAEATWDCPCHGSRYAADGTVLEGPALHPLRHLDV